MKPSEVYIKAAELIAGGYKTYACCAVSKISSEYWGVERRCFEKYFEPYQYIDIGECWFGPLTPKNQRARELALYLMAEIAKEWE